MQQTEMVTIPASLFTRMSKALIGVEKILEEQTEEWMNEESAISLLGCSRAKLYQLKSSGDVRYKAVGKKHQYNKKSIEAYNKKMSS